MDNIVIKWAVSHLLGFTTYSIIMSQPIITPSFEDNTNAERIARRERRLAAATYMRSGDSFEAWSASSPAQRMTRFWQQFAQMELESLRPYLEEVEKFMRETHSAPIIEVLDLALRIYVVYSVLKPRQSIISMDCIETFARCFDRARQEIGFAGLFDDSKGVRYVLDDPNNPVDRHIMANPEAFRIDGSESFQVPEKVYQELMVTPTYNQYYQKVNELMSSYADSVSTESDASAFAFCNCICGPDFILY